MAAMNGFPGGGASVKLKVITVAAAVNLPASAKEGTLAVITALALNKSYARATAPASPESGDVWVWIGGVSRAPIIISDYVMLYPRASYQREGAAWVLRESYIYTGSAWVEMSLYLYDAGAEILSTFSIGARSREPNTLTKNPANMVIYRQAGYDASVDISVMSDTAIDLTNVTTLKITFVRSSATETARFLVGSNRASYTADAYADMPAGTNTTSLNVSALSGVYYIGVYLHGAANENADTVKITAMWLER